MSGGGRRIGGGTIGWRTPAIIILAGCLIAILNFGTRSSMGLFLAPMSGEYGWGREVFGLAMAIQNLVWGTAQPFAGALADRYGPARVLAAGGVLYALGVALMAGASDPLTLHLSGGVLIGMGIAGSSFTVVIAAFAKMVSPERRSLAMGLGTAAGSMGQMLVVPLAGALLSQMDWASALYWLSLTVAVIVPLAAVFAGGASDTAQVPNAQQTFSQALSEAFGHRGYVLLTLGFFVCGFQVAFITVHMPAYLADKGLDVGVAATALLLVGMFNIVGSFTAGWVGGRFSKKSSLTVIYLARSAITAAYLLTPITTASTYLFAAAMGLFWLSTVPLTYGIVGQVFGPKYMTMLAGVTFFSHQVGSFLGVWGGGYLYDLYGSYDPVWWAGVVMGIVAALVHWPIDERPIARATAPAQ